MSGSVIEQKPIPQIQRVLSKLIINGTWICGTEFQQEFIPTYAQRISDLRKKGWDIQSDKCDKTNHSHTGNVFMYRIHDYNGWKNWPTWNVALWIGNEKCLYELAKRSHNYYNFICKVYNSSHSEVQKYKNQTPDGVKWNDVRVNRDDMDEFINDLKEDN